MTQLFKSDVQQLRQTIKSFQATFKGFIVDFVVNDIDGMENGATSLYQQGQFLNGTIVSILNRSFLWERICRNRQNQSLMRGIDHSHATLNCLLEKLNGLFYETYKGAVSDSSVCELAIVWHNFVSILRQALRDLEHQTKSWERSTLSKCMLKG